MGIVIRWGLMATVDGEFVFANDTKIQKKNFSSISVVLCL